MLGKLVIYIQKNETGGLYYTTHKINSKWIRDLNLRPRGSPRRKHKENTPWHLAWQEFYGYDTQTTSNKSKNKQVGIHQTKSLLHSKASN